MVEGAGLADRSLRQTIAVALDGLRQILTDPDEQSQAHRMSLTAFAIRVVGAGIAFLSQVLLARIMGQFEYGIFVFVWVIAIIVGSLSCMGFHTAIIRFLPQYIEQGATSHIRGIALTTRLVALTSATLFGAAGLGFLYLFGDTIASYYIVPLVLGVFALPMIALGDALDGTARANSWMLQALSPTYLLRPVLILIAMFTAVILGFASTAQTALVAALIAAYATTIAQLLVLGVRLERRFKRGPASYRLGYWFIIALPIFLIEGFYFLITNSDVVMVGMFLEPEDVATYFAAAKIMALVHFVLFAVKAGIMPRFSVLFVQNNRTELARFAAMSARWVFWPSMLLGIIVLALGPLLLSFFGSGFAAGYPVMFILFAGILFKALIGPGESLLTMAGEQKICALVYLAALCVNVAGNFALIPLLGIKGAATATMAAMALESLLLFVAVRTRLGINMSIFSRPKASADNSEAN